MDQHLYDKAQIILRHLRGELSQEEEKVFRQSLVQDEQTRQLLESLDDETALEEDLHFFSSVDTTAAWKKVASKTVTQPTYWGFWSQFDSWKYAASFSLLLLGGWLVYHWQRKETRVAVSRPPASKQHPIPTEGNKARLELADGSTLVLDGLSNGPLQTEHGVRISKSNGQLVYTADPTNTSKPVSYNRMVTPTGIQYQVVLPDGSKVWLNAQSSLRFPTAFVEEKRTVELTGEAYFEIALDKQKPFMVQVNDVQVEVLGTHFNVMAYPNEKSINTTLLEGSVKVSKGTSSQTLTPGQQGRVSAGIELVNVDPEEAVAWQKGLFQFNDSDLKTVMRQAERWYDVEVVYAGHASGKHFTGMLSRHSTITQFLQMLELAGGVNFRVDGKRVTVLP